MISRKPKREIIYSQRWICYRCHLTFETNSIANLHTQLSGHPTPISCEQILKTIALDQIKENICTAFMIILKI